MKKVIDFRDYTKLIQEYADKHCEGNFSMAVRVLINRGLLADIRDRGER